MTTAQRQRLPSHATTPRSRTWLATKALAKASWGLFNPKIWGLSVLPFVLASTVWGGLAFFAWDDATQMVRDAIAQVNLPVWLTHWLPAWLQTVMASSRAVWAVFGVLFLVVPAVLVTALALTSVFGVGVVARSVAGQYGLTPLPKGVLHQGFSALAGLWHGVWVLTVLALAWGLTLPLWLLPGMVLIVPTWLMAWANMRLFSRDVLVEFATRSECDTLRQQHRAALWVLGAVSTLPVFLPHMVWLSGAALVPFLPALAAVAVWLYIMVALATGLLFSHYLLAALKHLRDDAAAQAASDALAHGQAVLVETAHTPQPTALDAPAAVV